MVQQGSAPLRSVTSGRPLCPTDFVLWINSCQGPISRPKLFFQSRQGHTLRFFWEYLSALLVLHGSSSQNHRMFWVGRDLKGRSVTTSLLCRDQTRSTLGQNTRWPRMLGQATPPQGRGHGAQGLRQHLSLRRAPRMTEKRTGKAML